MHRFVCVRGKADAPVVQGQVPLPDHFLMCDFKLVFRQLSCKAYPIEKGAWPSACMQDKSGRGGGRHADGIIARSGCLPLSSATARREVCMHAGLPLRAGLLQASSNLREQQNNLLAGPPKNVGMYC